MPTDKEIAELLENQNDFLGRQPATLDESEKQVLLEIKKKGWYGEKFHDKNKMWDGIAMPMVRRVFSNLISQDLVSVKPMDAPTGQLFYLDYKYGTDEKYVNDVPVRYIMGVDPYENRTEVPVWNDTIMT